MLDACQILAGAADINGNGILDTCECVCDLNLDGNIGGADLSIVLGFWGVVTTFPRADFNNNGVVNGEDLAILLSQWGPCQ